MKYYSYESFLEDTKSLVLQSHAYQPDVIIAIARGGLILGQYMAYGLGVRDVQTIRAESYDAEVQRDAVSIVGECQLDGAKRILIVDDIVDSGNTLVAVLEHLDSVAPQALKRTASLFFKSSATVQPDYTVNEASTWIDFFWERDLA